MRRALGLVVATLAAAAAQSCAGGYVSPLLVGHEFENSAPGAFATLALGAVAVTTITRTALNGNIGATTALQYGRDSYITRLVFPVTDENSCIFEMGATGSGMYVGVRQGRQLRIRAGDGTLDFDAVAPFCAKCQMSYAAYADGRPHTLEWVVDPAVGQNYLHMWLDGVLFCSGSASGGRIGAITPSGNVQHSGGDSGAFGRASTIAQPVPIGESTGVFTGDLAPLYVNDAPTSVTLTRAPSTFSATSHAGVAAFSLLGSVTLPWVRLSGDVVLDFWARHETTSASILNLLTLLFLRETTADTLVQQTYAVQLISATARLYSDYPVANTAAVAVSTNTWNRYTVRRSGATLEFYVNTAAAGTLSVTAIVAELSLWVSPLVVHVRAGQLDEVHFFSSDATLARAWAFPVGAGDCLDVDECATARDDCDAALGTCANTNGSFSCACDPGYTAVVADCVDTDECAAGTHDCVTASETCANTVGGFTCPCRLGYAPVGADCVDEDECASEWDDCAAAATCLNTAGSFTCTCVDGFAGNGTSCVYDPPDECLPGGAWCSCSGLECICSNWHVGTGTVCEDIDECADPARFCDAATAVCTNMDGGFSCECAAGYASSGAPPGYTSQAGVDYRDWPYTRLVCVDVDECALGWTFLGYDEFDEEIWQQGTDDCALVGGNCSNTAGSFTCSCVTGFVGNGTFCENGDRCATGTHDCAPGEVCESAVGSFACVCAPGYASPLLVGYEFENAAPGAWTSLTGSSPAAATFERTPVGEDAKAVGTTTAFDMNRFHSGRDIFSTWAVFPATDETSCIFEAGGVSVGAYIGVVTGRLLRVRVGDGSTAFAIPSEFSARCQEDYSAYADGAPHRLEWIFSTNEKSVYLWVDGALFCAASATGARLGCPSPCSVNQYADLDAAGYGRVSASGGRPSEESATVFGGALAPLRFIQNYAYPIFAYPAPSFAATAHAGVAALSTASFAYLPGVRLPEDFTVDFWARHDATSAVTSALFSLGWVRSVSEGSLTVYTYSVQLTATGARLFSDYDNLGTVGVPVDAAVWHRFTVRRQGAALEFYVNQALAGGFSAAVFLGDASRTYAPLMLSGRPSQLDELHFFTPETALALAWAYPVGAGVCLDTDECAATSDDCDAAHGVCSNTDGSFTCACDAGYAAVGTACDDIDECATGACGGGVICDNTVGSFACSCPPGYTLAGAACVEDDECALEWDDCAVTAVCVNTPGSFTCTCLLGYPGNGTHCPDADECADATHDCDPHAACANTPGSFTCSCAPGYRDDAAGAYTADLPYAQHAYTVVINGVAFGRLDSTTALVTAQNADIVLDLLAPTRVVGVVTKGHGSSAQWRYVTQYEVAVGVNGATWESVRAAASGTFLFPGNSDQQTPVTRLFDRARRARFVRVRAVSWNALANPALRLGLQLEPTCVECPPPRSVWEYLQSASGGVCSYACLPGAAPEGGVCAPAPARWRPAPALALEPRAPTANAWRFGGRLARGPQQFVLAYVWSLSLDPHRLRWDPANHPCAGSRSLCCLYDVPGRYLVGAQGAALVPPCDDRDPGEWLAARAYAQRDELALVEPGVLAWTLSWAAGNTSLTVPRATALGGVHADCGDRPTTERVCDLAVGLVLVSRLPHQRDVTVQVSQQHLRFSASAGGDAVVLTAQAHSCVRAVYTSLARSGTTWSLRVDVLLADATEAATVDRALLASSLALALGPRGGSLQAATVTATVAAGGDPVSLAIPLPLEAATLAAWPQPVAEVGALLRTRLCLENVRVQATLGPVLEAALAANLSAAPDAWVLFGVTADAPFALAHPEFATAPVFAPGLLAVVVAAGAAVETLTLVHVRGSPRRAAVEADVRAALADETTLRAACLGAYPHECLVTHAVFGGAPLLGPERLRRDPPLCAPGDTEAWLRALTGAGTDAVRAYMAHVCAFASGGRRTLLLAAAQPPWPPGVANSGRVPDAVLAVVTVVMEPPPGI